MSWHFSRALVEDYSRADCSGGEPSARSNSIDTAETYSCPGRTTAALSDSPSGTTCGPSTVESGAGLLTWFRAGSRARTSAPPDEAPGSTEIKADSGPSLLGSFARWDRDSSSWRTPQCSLLGGSDEFLETWPRWGSMRNGVCWGRTMPAHLTNVTESGSSLPAMPKWSTPMAHNAKETNAPSEADRNTPTLAAQVGGKLNPTWVEWLMGWPLEWTASAPLGTAKFRRWLRSHGAPSERG